MQDRLDGRLLRLIDLVFSAVVCCLQALPKTAEVMLVSVDFTEVGRYL